MSKDVKKTAGKQLLLVAKDGDVEKMKDLIKSNEVDLEYTNKVCLI